MSFYEEPVLCENVGNLVVKVFYDEDPISPNDREDDYLFFIHYHRDLEVENKQVREEDLARWYQTQVYGDALDPEEDYRLVELMEQFWIFPVAAYIHGGVALYIGNANQDTPFDPGGWDTSHVGAVFASKKEWSDREEAWKCASGLVDEWNQYLSGEVYGFRVEDQDGNHIDSCWGFYGEAEYCLSEGIASAKSHDKQSILPLSIPPIPQGPRNDCTL